jgi:hypothetical protein
LPAGCTSNDDDLPIKTTHDIPLVHALIGMERLGECTKLWGSRAHRIPVVGLGLSGLLYIGDRNRF